MKHRPHPDKDEGIKPQKRETHKRRCIECGKYLRYDDDDTCIECDNLDLFFNLDLSFSKEIDDHEDLK